MKIGRIEFGTIHGSRDWSYMVGPCKCRILSLGRFYVTLLDKDCTCVSCKKNICICSEEII